MPLQYSDFELTPDQQYEKEVAQRQSYLRERDLIVKQFRLKLLKSDYLDMSSYYYDSSSDSIYEHQNTKGKWTQLQRNSDVAQHLFALNKI